MAASFAAMIYILVCSETPFIPDAAVEDWILISIILFFCTAQGLILPLLIGDVEFWQGSLTRTISQIEEKLLSLQDIDGLYSIIDLIVQKKR